MTYFSNLPAKVYDFNIGNDSELRVIKDITLNLRFKRELLKDITLFDSYDIKEGETPEKVSEKFYGTPQYHWVVMLLNDRFDVLNDWPMSGQQFERYMNEKYGSGNFRNIHHYTTKSGNLITDESIYIDPYKTNEKVFGKTLIDSNKIESLTPGGFAELNHFNNQPIKVTALSLPQEEPVYITTFVDGSTLLLNKPALYTETLEITFQHMVNPLLDAIAVTNIDYENAVNDSLRRIKILHPSVMSQVINQFNTLVK